MMEIEQPPFEKPKKSKRYKDLLSLPTINELDMETQTPKTIEKIDRKTHNFFRDASERFQLKKKSFDRQYAHIYSKRLEKLRPFVSEEAKKRFPEANFCEKISKAEDGVLSIITGTVIKDMPLISRVLDEFSKEKGIAVIPGNQSLVSPKDTLILEDEEGRIILIADRTLINSLVTGMIVAIIGRASGGGREFDVIDYCFSSFPEQPVLPKVISEENRYVALVSGLRVGDSNQNPLAFQLFIDYVTGYLGSLDEIQFAGTISRIIIAGNSIVAPEKLPESSGIKHIRKTISVEQQRKLLVPLQELDSSLSQLSQSIHVDIMPGESDPSHYVLPQQPFARCLLPKSYEQTTFRCVTNPYECEIDDKIFLGTSGQNISNLERYVVIEDKLDLLERTIKSRHIAPTAPDQLGCYPFYDQDPFVLERCPHVYFIGNQKQFATKLIHGPKGEITRLISLPSFADTPMVVLVNLKDLNVHPLSFNVNM